jgi:hypothetical protein
MVKGIVKIFLVCMFIAGLTVSVYAQPILNPVNGHYYELIGPSPMTWTQARDIAAGRSFMGMQGYLATVTSFAEQGFVNAHFTGQDAWIGGYQLDDQSATDGWQWVTGEPWSYTNWDGGEPNDCCDVGDPVEDNEENYLMLNNDAFWNDQYTDGSLDYALVEYETNNCVGSICYVPCDPMGAGCPESFCFIRVPSPIGVIDVGQIHYLGSGVACIMGACPPGCTVFVPTIIFF